VVSFLQVSLSTLYTNFSATIQIPETESDIIHTGILGKRSQNLRDNENHSIHFREHIP